MGFRGFRRLNCGFLFVALSLVFIFASPSFAEELNYAPNEIIVKFKSDVKIETPAPGAAFSIQSTAAGKDVTALNALLQKHGAKSPTKLFTGTPVKSFPAREKRRPAIQKKPDLTNIYKVEIAPVTTDQEMRDLINKYKEDPNVEYVQPNYLYTRDAIPDDTHFNNPYFGEDGLWGLKKIDASGAWDINQGSSDIVIAVIDSGVRYTHNDLNTNIWRNPADNTVGWNFEDGNNDPSDNNGHGTHIAGTISGIGNNNLGITGVSWNSKIMAVKTSLASDNIAAGILYAADNGADIINLSLGFDDGSGTVNDTNMERAITHAVVSGVIVVVSAGNKNQGIINRIPSNYENVICVSATDALDAKWWESDIKGANYGAAVDVSAPGRRILSTFKGSNTDYALMSGTSMALSIILAEALANLIVASTPAEYIVINCPDYHYYNNASGSRKTGLIV